MPDLQCTTGFGIWVASTWFTGVMSQTYHQTSRKYTIFSGHSMPKVHRIRMVIPSGIPVLLATSLLTNAFLQTGWQFI